jgi:pilus assembly protein CpaE
MRTAKADFGQTGFDDDFGGFDVDDDFAMPSTPSEASGVMTWEEPGVALSTARAEPASGEPSAPGPGSMEGALLIGGGDAVLGESAVPRIGIHIFCQRNETAALAEQMKADRRLARASTIVRAGGLDDALTIYQNQPTPSLIMVESTADATTLLAGLDRLAEVCDPGTKVVVIGTHNDIPLYRELMRRGVSEYLVPPLQTLQLIRVVTTLYSDPTTPFIGRTLAFVGAKGGVGASTVAHNVAYAMSEQTHASTVIVDYDLPFGTAGLDFNQDPLQGFADALSKPDRLDPVLLDRMTARCGDRLSLFAAPASLDDDHEYSADTYEEVLGKIRATAPYVVLDLPHLWTGWMRRTLLSADDVVVVAAPDLASLRNAKNLLDLVRKGRPNDQPPQLILNQVGVPGRPEIPVKDFSKALGLEPTLVLPFDAKLFGQAANNGQMIQEINGKSKVSEGLAQFAQQLSRREPVATAPKTAKSLIERLRNRG